MTKYVHAVTNIHMTLRGVEGKEVMPLDQREKFLGRTGFKMSLLLPREMGLYSDIATPFSSRAREPKRVW